MAMIQRKEYQRRAIAAIAIALYAGVLLRAVAQDPKGLNIDVANCVELEKPEDRLACFEAKVAAARQRAAPASKSAATGASTAAATGGGAAAVTGGGAPAVTGAGAAAVTGASAPAVTAASTVAITAASAAASKEAGTGAAAGIPASTAAAEPVPAATASAVQSQKPASEPRSAANVGGAERSPDRQPVEIVATVTELRQTVPNAYVITLDNGQVWRQAHPMPYPLRTGLVVHVRETNFGYRLTAPELHGQINVERVR
jgi:hypothetical protein